MAICADPLFEQALVIGEQKPYLSALLVVNEEEWEKLANQLGLTPDADLLNYPAVHEHVIQRMQGLLTEFPGYAKIYRVSITLDAWTVENNLMTPTLKLKRQQILDMYADKIDQMYLGH